MSCLAIAAATISGRVGDLWAAKHDDVWIVSSLLPGAEIAHFDGIKWSTTKVDSFLLDAVWGTRSDAIWAAGAEAISCTNCGGLLRWDGTSWFVWNTRLHSESVSGIWGSAADDVWAVGSDGAILHFNGNVDAAEDGR